jgi:hypothetical protein
VLPHKYKTSLCKHFQEKKSCPFDTNCNYAHGEDELEKYLERQRRLEAADKQEVDETKEVVETM